MDDERIQFFKNMLQALVCCRQNYVLHEHNFRWFITFIFFQAAFDCIGKQLDRLTQFQTEVTPKSEYGSLGKVYRALSKKHNVQTDHARSFDLLDAMHARILRQQDNFAESGHVSVTIYRDQHFITTYGYTAELLNPTLLFTILEDVGNLFSDLILEPVNNQPVSFFAGSRRKSSAL
ncbi:hypothetical protein [Sporomusa sp.]|uniref:hypothetical protein n=1 Tax=Sporomusa sp. TaxID=2078658 RepID=UPI002BE84210|nr:hypothetical protein [Sporomusa sp.]HWR45895.1 hypothetical protein [Sporomusa sp.]